MKKPHNSSNAVSTERRTLRSNTVAKRLSCKSLEEKKTSRCTNGKKANELKLSLSKKRKTESEAKDIPTSKLRKRRKTDTPTLSEEEVTIVPVPIANSHIPEQNNALLDKASEIKFKTRRRRETSSVVKENVSTVVPVFNNQSQIIEKCSVPNGNEKEVIADKVKKDLVPNIKASKLKCRKVKSSLSTVVLEECNSVLIDCGNKIVESSETKTEITNVLKQKSAKKKRHKMGKSSPLRMKKVVGLRAPIIKSSPQILEKLHSVPKDDKSDIDCNQVKEVLYLPRSKLRPRKFKSITSQISKKCYSISTDNNTNDILDKRKLKVSKTSKQQRCRKKYKTSKSSSLLLDTINLAPIFIKHSSKILQKCDIVSVDSANDFVDVKKTKKGISSKPAIKLKKYRKGKSATPVPGDKIKLAPIFIKQSPQISEKGPTILIEHENYDVELKHDFVYDEQDLCIPGCHIQQISNEMILEWTSDQHLEMRHCETCIDTVKPNGWIGILGITDVDVIKVTTSDKKVYFNEKYYSGNIMPSDAGDDIKKQDAQLKRRKSTSHKSRLSMRRRKKKTVDNFNSPDLETFSLVPIDPSITKCIVTEKEHSTNLLAGNMENISWVEKYKPLKSEDVIGNHQATDQLKNWLNYWKNKGSVLHKETDCLECDYDVSSDSETDFPNCIILYGPSGSGKTNLVYCLANELGFKVFEVNVSSGRSGRKVTTQLREATQSHHVEGKVLSLDELVELQAAEMKRRYSKKERQINSMNKCGKIKNFFKTTSTKKNRLWKDVENSINSNSALRKHSLKAVNKSSLSSKSITSFFSTTSTTKEDSCEVEEICDVCFESDNVSNISVDEQVQGDKTKETSVVQGLSISSHSLILFDDVDVIFKEDEGFWNAVNAFLRSTKKSVVLTASSSLLNVRRNITHPYEIISLELPDMDGLCGYLTNIFKTENMDMNLENVHYIINHLGYDVRKSLLHMQFWCKLEGNNILPDTKDDNCQRDTNTVTLLGKTDSVQCVEELKAPSWNVWDSLLHKFLKSSLHKNRECTYLAAINTQQGYIDNLSLIHINLAQLLSFPLTTSLPISSFADSRIHSILTKQEEISCNELAELQEQSVKSNTSSEALKKPERPELKRNTITFYFKSKKDELSCALTDSLNTMANIMDGISFSDILMHPLQTNEHNSSNNHYCYIDENYPSYRSVITDVVSDLGAIHLVQTKNQVEKIMEKVQKESAALFTLPHEGSQSLKEKNALFESKLENTLSCYTELSNLLPTVSRLQHKAISVDYLGALRNICQFESLKQANKLKRAGRFLHYLDSICIGTDDKLYHLLKK